MRILNFTAPSSRAVQVCAQWVIPNFWNEGNILACITESKSLIDYVVAITPIVISLVVAVFAWRQWRINKNKLLSDVYDKRFSVYENTVMFYWAIMRENDLMPLVDLLSVQDKFLMSWLESKFLFNSDDGIYKILDEFRKQTNPFVDRRKGVEVGALRSDKLEEHLIKLEITIFPYLNLTKWGIPNRGIYTYFKLRWRSFKAALRQ